MKKKTLLIVGCGNLGSRYIQGLAYLSIPLEVFIYDINKSAISHANMVFNENKNKNHEINICENLSSIPSSIDLVIIATTAFERHKIIESISNFSTVDYWLIEKVLEQNTKNLRLIQNSLKECIGAWVNTPRRIIPWYCKIKRKISLRSPLHFTYTGGKWGLACNSIHFIDLFSWITSETAVSYDSSLLEKNWVQSKRKGYFDIFGTLLIKFSRGSILELKSTNIDSLVSFIEIQDSNGIWSINERDGLASHTNGSLINGKIPLHSELTPFLLNDILYGGFCELPDLKTSIEMHEKFLDCMLSHWQHNMSYNSETLPIT
jgi:hypothetical protein